MPTSKLKRLVYIVVSLLVLVMQTAAVHAAPLSGEDLNTVVRDSGWHDGSVVCAADGSSSASGTVDVSVTGNNVKDAFEFFVQNGYSGPQAAGIVGNMQQESTASIDPHITNSIGAHGIVQWLGGRLTAMREWVSGQAPPNNDPESLRGQLGYVLHELETSYTTTAKAVKAATTPTAAATAFNVNYEKSGDTSGVREANARAVYSKAVASGWVSGADANTVTDSGTDTSNNCASSASAASVDCNATGTAVTGNAKILCEAKKYDPASYGRDEGVDDNHSTNASWLTHYCKTIDSTCTVDCSGLVSIAVYDAFGKANNFDKTWNTSTLVSDTQYWKRISKNDLKPGDIIEPNSGHVEIVDHIEGTKIWTFGAHNPNVAQPNQVSTEQYMTTTANYYAYLRYVGPGGGTQ